MEVSRICLGCISFEVQNDAEALYTSDRLGLERFATMQDHYNLACREEEREVHPLCEKEDIGVIPWSPLSQGYLTRPHKEMTTTTHGEELTERLQEYRDGSGPKVNERVEELAKEKGVRMAQISLAWLLHRDAVDAPMSGRRASNIWRMPSKGWISTSRSRNSSISKSHTNRCRLRTTSSSRLNRRLIFSSQLIGSERRHDSAVRVAAR